MENFSKDSRSPGRDMNPGLSNHAAYGFRGLKYSTFTDKPELTCHIPVTDRKYSTPRQALQNFTDKIQVSLPQKVIKIMNLWQLRSG